MARDEFPFNGAGANQQLRAVPDRGDRATFLHERPGNIDGFFPNPQGFDTATVRNQQQIELGRTHGMNRKIWFNLALPTVGQSASSDCKT